MNSRQRHEYSPNINAPTWASLFGRKIQRSGLIRFGQDCTNVYNSDTFDSLEGSAAFYPIGASGLGTASKKG